MQSRSPTPRKFKKIQEGPPTTSSKSRVSISDLLGLETPLWSPISKVEILGRDLPTRRKLEARNLALAAVNLQALQMEAGLPPTLNPPPQPPQPARKLDIVEVLNLRITNPNPVANTQRIHVPLVMEYTSQVPLTGRQRASIGQQFRTFAENWSAISDILRTQATVLSVIGTNVTNMLDSTINKAYKKSLFSLQRLNNLLFSSGQSLFGTPYPVADYFNAANEAISTFSNPFVDPIVTAVLETAMTSTCCSETEKDTSQSHAARMREYRFGNHLTVIRFEEEFNSALIPAFADILRTHENTLSVTTSDFSITWHHKGGAGDLLRKDRPLEKQLASAGIQRSHYDFKTGKKPEDELLQAKLYARSPSINIIYSVMTFLLTKGFIQVREARRAVLKAWEDPADAPQLRTALKRLKLYRTRYLFRSYPLTKSKLLALRSPLLAYEEEHFSIYYSDIVRNHIQAGYFDALFVDGTYLRRAENSQMLIVRLYSSHSKETITCAYSFCKKKDANAYEAILGHLKNAGFLDHIKVVMSDFEKALGVAFGRLFPQVEQRFCLFHLVNATKRYAGKINKAITRSRDKSLDLVSVKLNLLTSYTSLAGAGMARAFLIIADYFLTYLQPTIRPADIVYLTYFYKTYLVRYKVNLGDLHAYPFLTNNTLEGTNSGLKRFLFGKKTVQHAKEWIQEDVKKNVLKFNEQSKLDVSDQFRNIAALFKGDTHWLLPVTAKAFSVEPRKLRQKLEHDALVDVFKQLTAFSTAACDYTVTHGGRTVQRRIPSSFEELSVRHNFFQHAAACQLIKKCMY